MLAVLKKKWNQIYEVQFTPKMSEVRDLGQENMCPLEAQTDANLWNELMKRLVITSVGSHLHK